MEYITWKWADQLLKTLFVAGMVICERNGTTRKITSFVYNLRIWKFIISLLLMVKIIEFILM